MHLIETITCATCSRLFTTDDNGSIFNGLFSKLNATRYIQTAPPYFFLARRLWTHIHHHIDLAELVCDRIIMAV